MSYKVEASIVQCGNGRISGNPEKYPRHPAIYHPTEGCELCRLYGLEGEYTKVLNRLLALLHEGKQVQAHSLVEHVLTHGPEQGRLRAGQPESDSDG